MHVLEYYEVRAEYTHENDYDFVVENLHEECGTCL